MWSKMHEFGSEFENAFGTYKKRNLKFFLNTVSGDFGAHVIIECVQTSVDIKMYCWVICKINLAQLIFLTIKTFSASW